MCKHVHTITPTCIKKWEEIHNIHNLSWKHIFGSIYEFIRCTKLRAFHYTFIHRYVPHNKRLHQMQLVVSNVCNRCNTTIDTVEHRFFECTYLQTFWKSFIIWFNDINATHFRLSPEHVYFTVNSDNTMTKCFMFCVTVAKYYIHLRCCQNAILTLTGYISIMKKYANIEYSLIKCSKNDDIRDMYNVLINV